FCHNFICFFTFNLLQMASFIVLSKGVLSYNPPVRKSAFQAFDGFLIQPPPSLQNCPRGLLGGGMMEYGSDSTSGIGTRAVRGS
ncbi:hypothetical protein HOY82DRAFT_476580, partial [Tuber indicum]